MSGSSCIINSQNEMCMYTFTAQCSINILVNRTEMFHMPWWCVLTADHDVRIMFASEMILIIDVKIF